MKLGLKILIPILGIALVAIAAIIFISVQVLQNAFFKEKALTLSFHVKKEIGEILSKEDLQKEESDEDLIKKFRQLSEAVSDPSIFRIKVWDKNWRVVYSNLDNIIGKSADEDLDLGHLFRKDSVFRWEKVERIKQGSSETGFGSYINVLVPVQDQNQETKYVLELFSAVSAIAGQLQSSTINLVYFLIGIALISLTLIYLMIYLVVIKPIRKLEEAVNIVKSGDLTHELISRSGDEIGTLSNNFNDMRMKLQNLIGQIEKKGNELSEKVFDLEKFKKLTVGRELKMIELKKALGAVQEELKKKGG